MNTETNNQNTPPHRRPFDPNFKAYTIYRHGGRREIVWGYSGREALATTGRIGPRDFVINGLDCKHHWDVFSGKWLQMMHLEFNSSHTIEDIRSALPNLDYSSFRYTFPDNCVVDLWCDYGHYDDGVARYITVSVREPTEPPADYDVGHPEYGKQWYMGCGSLMFRPFDRVNAVAAFINIIEAESKTSFKTKSVEGAVSIQQLLEEQKDQLP